MTEPQAATWTIPLRELWGRIERHDFEPGLALDFTKRLARDRDWTLDYGRAAVLEYRRFCFLAVASSEPVTPSEEVDEVWHLHLTYSSDYWDVWCRTVLRTPLHHDPTRGGPAEQTRHRAQYAATLARYEGFFGPPPPSFWPATHQLFRDMPRFRTIDAERWFLLPRPTVLWRRISDAGRLRWR